MIRKVRQSLAIQISAILLCMVVLCAVLVGVSSTILYRGDNVDSNADRALAVAQSVAALVNADKFTEIMASGEANDYWYEVKAILDDIKKRTDVKYLYVLDSNYGDTMTYFAEGYNPETDTEGDTELGFEEVVEEDGVPTYADEMYETIRTGQPMVSELYDSGDFGTMVSGFAAVKDSAGKVVGVVGADISLAEVMTATTAFALRIVLIIVLFCAVAIAFSIWFMNRLIGRPIGELTKASDKLAEGDMDIHLSSERQDEIGQLSRSFEAMVEHTREQAEVLEQMANGDLTMQVVARGENDLMSTAMAQTIARLNEMFRGVKASSSEVASGADQIANGAQILAQGSTEQAATLEEFTAAITGVLQQSEENATQATDAYNDTMQAGSLMAECMETMGRLTAAMQEINDSSEKIAGVIKVVDDIAFQTNILALNAAVEAARAGEHGKGFAVVADEVRNLAAKSAEAAKETTTMISTNIEKVSEGADIADQTQENMKSVNDILGANAQAMERISAASEEQNHAISEITTGIGELSNVVQANSATSEQSAASAEEMSSQAQMLNSIVDRFRIQEGQRALPG
ncbi:methyl-accepting chemotaxis protein [Ruminococcaceae bacterium OttesenSCG-928-D13]|nr:methyl-accepting chemotaxis protein [Ruminococcaceae bacterium OttesenSCG-928-D13]